MRTVWLCIQNDWASRTVNLHQILHLAQTFLWGNYSHDSEGSSSGQLVMGSFITTTHPLMHHISCRVFQWNIKSPSWLSPDMAYCDFWFFPKLKSPLKGKRFQTVNEIQENMTRQLISIGRTVWGPKVPTLKGTEASLSYVQCFLYLVSSSISVYF